MRKLWRHFLALSLGVVTAGAYAQDAPRPIASSRPAGAPAPAAQVKPAVVETAASLGRPVAIAASRPDAPVARGSSALTTENQPVVPANAAAIYPGLHSWRRADEGVVQTARAMPSGGPLPAPSPANNGMMTPMPPAPSMPAGPYNAGPPMAGPMLMPPATGVPSIYATSPGIAGVPCPAAPCCGTGACATPGYAPTVGAPSCGCGSVCPPGNIWFVGVEYLMWTMKGDVTPPLVTSNPTTFSALGPGTTVLYGGNGLGDQTTSGMRVTLGMWFSDAHCWGIEASGFFLGKNSDHFTASSFGETFLGRPFTNVGAMRLNPATGQLVANAVGSPDVERVGDPRGLNGRVDVERSNRLWGGEFNFKRGLLCGDCGYLNLLFGFRTLGLDESLAITENLATTAMPSTRFVVQDRFETSNRFYGGQVGLDGEYRYGNWSFGARAKIGLGCTQQMSELSGSTTASVPSLGLSQSAAGGLLVQPGTNLGTRFRTPFSVVPELGLTLGYQVRPWMRVTVGYNFLYWSNVIRPGGTVDTTVNTAYLPFNPANYNARAAGSQFTQPARPANSFNGSDFWAQGLTVGLEFKF